ncbi:MAG: replication restart helicase PriA [Anaerolineaceae bacterium]|jgi:primosomal protein N' (replication factor Y)
MTQYVEVSTNIAKIDRTYHYSLPPELEGKVTVGSLVEVPFGAQVAQGIVMGFVEQPEVPETLDIYSVLSEDTLITPQQIELAEHLAKATFAPLGACMRMMIPSGLSQRAETLITLGEKPASPDDLPPLQKRILKLVAERESLRGGQLAHALPKLSWQSSLRALRDKGLVKVVQYLPPPSVSSKKVRMAALSVPPKRIADYPHPKSERSLPAWERRKRVLDLLAFNPFPTDFSWVYAQTGANYADLKKLAEEGWIHFDESEVWRDPLDKVSYTPLEPPQLTEDQENAWQKIDKTLGKACQPLLLHGVTGSGKTEIYLRAFARLLEQGRQALFLVPEISMTPQTIRRVLARFPNQVGLFHHKLSEGERYDTWRRVRSGDIRVVIGARSALFLPYTELGIIVMDECDNDSYDETERLPYYRAEETAEFMASQFNANLIFGSATPRVTQFFKAQKGDWNLISLPRRILAHRDALLAQAAALNTDLHLSKDPSPLLTFELPKVQVVDMRQELKQGNTSVLSRVLYTAIQQTLARSQQAILFLNRKGSSTYVFCRSCGYTLRCPRDEMPLVYHASRSGLFCHTCGYSRKLPEKCPNCGSKKIRQLGLGTERLESLVQQAFPEARVLRWDAQSASRKDEHELILSHFSAHRADILIGTQILAKGLDLPLVTLVGIVLAEVGLNLPDYRAPERTYQVLTQVAGRAGRSPLGGQVILQTYEPDNEVIQAAALQDYAFYYHQELAHRREQRYPPYSCLIRLEYRHNSEEKCRTEAQILAGIIEDEIEGLGRTQTDFIGPLPCFYRKRNNQFRWQIILRGPNPITLLNNLPLRNWIVEADPSDLL